MAFPYTCILKYLCPWVVFGRFRMVSDGFGPFSDRFGRFWTIFGSFRTVSDRFGLFRTVFGPFLNDFRIVSDRFRRLWSVFGPFSDDSTQNLKISNFNWPGLGPVRAVPSVRAVRPQPWPIEI